MNDNQKEKVKEPTKKFNLRTVFYHNTFVLIFSFICAVVIWFSMAASKMELPLQINDVPIEIQLSDSAKENGIRVFSQSTDKATVSVTGNSFITSKVTADDIKVYAQLSPSANKAWGNMVTSESVKLSAEKKSNKFADYEVVGVSPEALNVVYDRYKETTFQITNNTVYTVADAFSAESPVLSAEKVVVSGPESAVNKIGKISLDYTIGEPLSSSMEFTGVLTVYDTNNKPMDVAANYLTLSVDTVDVLINVKSKQTVSLEVTKLNVPEGFSESRITIEPATIDIAGDFDVVSKYKTLPLEKSIDFSEISMNDSKTISIPMNIALPPDVTNISKITQATVTINLSGFTENTLNVTNLNMINVPDTKTVNLITKSLPVNIVGSEAQMSSLTSSSVYGTIDMAGQADQNGNREVTVSIYISGATSCWAYGKYTVQVSVEDKKVEEAVAAVTPAPSAGNGS